MTETDPPRIERVTHGSTGWAHRPDAQGPGMTTDPHLVKFEFPTERPRELHLLLGANAQQTVEWLREREMPRIALGTTVFPSRRGAEPLRGRTGKWIIHVSPDSDPRPFAEYLDDDDMAALREVNRQMVTQGFDPMSYADIQRETARGHIEHGRRLGRSERE